MTKSFSTILKCTCDSAVSLSCSAKMWTVMSDRVPVQGQSMPDSFLKGHSLLWNKHSARWRTLSSSVNVSTHPSSLFLHGYIAVAANFSRVIFRALINCPLQVGHSLRRSLQLLQMLCPFSHILIGDDMYSKQTGHSSSSKSPQSSCLSNVLCVVLWISVAIPHHPKQKRNQLIADI